MPPDANDILREEGTDALRDRLDRAPARPRVNGRSAPKADDRASPEDRYSDNGRAAAAKAAALAGDKQAFDWTTKSKTAAQLSRLQIPDIRWIIQRFLPEGVGILAAKPKIGKSWLTLEWCIAIASGEPVFGGTVNITPMEGDVLYLALEDNDRRLKSRLAKLCLKSPERLTLVSMSDGFPRMHEGGLEAIDAWLIAHPQAKLVAIDTLAKFRPPANAKKGAYDQDYDAITPLLNLAHKYRIAILIIHHQRKLDSDDPFDSISGTLGLTAAVDTLMLLHRRADGVVFCMRGRDVEDEELSVQFDKDTATWNVLGTAQDVRRSATDTAIVEVLYEAFKEAEAGADTSLSAEQIKSRAGLKMKADTLRQNLKRLADKGVIRRNERGRYASP
jgi:hypothetical protein